MIYTNQYSLYISVPNALKEMDARPVCYLCRHACSEGEIKENIQTIKAWILEAAGQCDAQEIASQVARVMTDELNLPTTEEQVLTHMKDHMLDRRLVMSNIVKDLLKIANTTRDACLYVDDAANTCIDTKVLSTYLKTVDSITGIYRSVNFDK